MSDTAGNTREGAMPTNTVVICRLPRELIENVPEIVSTPTPLEGLAQFAQIKFMRRVLAVFNTPASARAALPLIEARIQAHPQCKSAHVGFSVNDFKNMNPSDEHLALPDSGKLLFVSPPPSPPAGWVDQLEEKPNEQVHYEQEFNDRLYNALTRAAQTQNSPYLDSPRDSDSSQSDLSPESPRVVTIIPPKHDSPAITVTSDA